MAVTFGMEWFVVSVLCLLTPAVASHIEYAAPHSGVQSTDQSVSNSVFVCFFGLISAMPVHSTSFPPNLFQSEDLPCRAAEMLSHLLRCRRCSISLLKSGMDQSVAFCASPAAGSSAFPVSAACGHFPNPLQ